MASKAHVIHDHSFGGAHARPRRLILRRRDTDPVVLPRTSIWRLGGGVVVTALAMGALVVGSAYAAYRPTTPQLAETPALPLADAWQPDTSFVAASVTNVLQGPALAAPDRAVPFVENDTLGDVPSASSESSASQSRSFESAAPAAPAESREVIIDDSKLYPSPKTEPYPNPTTTPPEGVAPPATPLAPTTLDPENPYRD